MAKAAINPPVRQVTDPQYQPDCRFALEPSFLGLAKNAIRVGWEPKEVAYALMMLAAAELQERSKDDPDQPAAR